jgi:predicted metal-dependent peptidase
MHLNKYNFPDNIKDKVSGILYLKAGGKEKANATIDNNPPKLISDFELDYYKLTDFDFSEFAVDPEYEKYLRNHVVTEGEFLSALKEAEMVLFNKCKSIYSSLYFMLEKKYIFSWSPEKEREWCPTASVQVTKSSRRDSKYQVRLNINADFFIKTCITTEQRAGLLEHEMLHIILGHLWRAIAIKNRSDKGYNSVIVNIANDLAINSIVCGYKYNQFDNTLSIDGKNLPLVSAVKVRFYEDFTYLEEKNTIVIHSKKKFVEKYMYSSSGAMPGLGVFKNLLPGMSSDEYLSIIAIPENYNKIYVLGGSGIGPFGIDSDLIVDSDIEMDETYEDDIEALREEIESNIKSRILDAMAKGEMLSGNAMLNNALTRLVLPNPNYDEILKNFIATNIADKEDSWVRENRRDIDGMCGSIYNPEYEVAIFIDQSGSMSNEDIEKCFGRITNLLDSAQCRIYNFANEIDYENAYDCSNSSELRYERTISGGTAFEPIFDYLSKNQDRYAVGFIISDMGNNRGVPQKTVDNVAFVCDKSMSCLIDTAPYEEAGFIVCKM